MIVLNALRRLLLPRALKRAGANGDRFYGGPPYGREPFDAPSLYDPARDFDGIDHAARMRSRALVMRKQAAHG